MKTTEYLEEKIVGIDPENGSSPGFEKKAKDPKRAALLSIIPGLGQIYNGQTVKGYLFIASAIVNLAVLSIILGFKPIIGPVSELLNSSFHIEANQDWVASLESIKGLSTFLALYVGLYVYFLIYAVKDAYDQALAQNRGTQLPRFNLGLPESTSGSYLFHSLVMILCLLGALFVFTKEPPKQQITDIELVPPPPPEPPPAPKRPKAEPKQETPKEEPKKVEPRKQVEKPVENPKPVVATPITVEDPNAANADYKTPDSNAPQANTTTTAGSSTGSGSGSSGGGGGDGSDVDFGPFMADMQRRIKKAWFPPPGNEAKVIKLKFKVRADGSVGSIKLIASSGLAIADDAAVTAVKNAAPFMHLPKGADDPSEIRFTFDYQVMNAGGKSLSIK